jgi:hypothetical protein
MEFFKKRTYLNILLSYVFLVLGCGKEHAPDLALIVNEGRSQVAITLHSQLELDYTLEPDSQLEVAEAERAEFLEVDNKPKARAYAQLKRKSMFSSQAGPLPEFKTDTEYQSIQRYERIERHITSITKKPQKPQIREMVKVQDKPLIFAGRGFNISAFERENKPAIEVDYATHLVSVYHESNRSQHRERLDLEEEYSRDTKYLIYNPTRSAFGKLPPPLVDNLPDLLQKEGPDITPKKNLDSVILFPHGEQDIFVLSKAKKQFDLLAGNESLNKQQFKAFKVPETSKKISNTRQLKAQ